MTAVLAIVLAFVVLTLGEFVYRVRQQLRARATTPAAAPDWAAILRAGDEAEAEAHRAALAQPYIPRETS